MPLEGIKGAYGQLSKNKNCRSITDNASGVGLATDQPHQSYIFFPTEIFLSAAKQAWSYVGNV